MQPRSRVNGASLQSHLFADSCLVLLSARGTTKGNHPGIMISMTVSSNGFFEKQKTLPCLIIGTGRLSHSAIAETLLTSVQYWCADNSRVQANLYVIQVYRLLYLYQTSGSGCRRSKDYRGHRDTARYLHQPYRMGELLQTSDRPLDRD
jgi:hypothetical protein